MCCNLFLAASIDECELGPEGFMLDIFINRECSNDLFDFLFSLMECAIDFIMECFIDSIWSEIFPSMLKYASGCRTCRNWSEMSNPNLDLNVSQNIRIDLLLYRDASGEFW